MLLTDSDGVLTDGGMYYTENGDEMKKFNTKDGMGFQLLREKGIKTGIVTGENRELVKNRALKMKVDELHMGISNKIEVIRGICVKHNISLSDVAYIGDDINDIEVIKTVGFGCCVNDAMESVKEIAKYKTKANGGQGAVREVAELILLSRNSK
jgi:N-acylneuraminate cytidylyltransferase